MESMEQWPDREHGTMAQLKAWNNGPMEGMEQWLMESMKRWPNRKHDAMAQ
jgi:hypothetical protein